MRIASFHFEEQPTNLWERIVVSKASAPNMADRASFLVGIDIDSRAPVCIPRRTLEACHYHIRGMTGSGKTAAAIMPLILQILRGYEGNEGEVSERCPIVILDLKGDQALFNTVWSASLKSGRTFRYFSTRRGDDYHFFDPFQMFRLGHLLPIQLATEFIRAFSLDYGLIYGGLYFTHQNLDILRQAIEEMLSRPSPELTIETLARILQRIARSTQNTDARHIVSCLNLLAAYPQVNIIRDQSSPHQRIEMARALEESEVLYFFMQMEGEAPSLRQVASLALYSLVEAAKFRYHLGLPIRHTYVIIDEFYHIAGKSFGELLSTVRAWGIHMVLANQSIEQLKNHDHSLPDVVSTNTGIEQAFTLRPDDEEYFQAASGETLEYLKSFGVSANRMGPSVSETTTPHKTSFLSDAALKFVNDTQLASLMLIHDGTAKAAGRRVLRVQGLYPISKEAYERFQSTPFPKRPPDVFGDFIVGDVPQPASEPAMKSNEPVSESMQELDRRMATKWHELESGTAHGRVGA